MTPGRETCLLCGGPLPERKWWDKLLLIAPPTHDPDGPDGEACWRGLSARLGYENPGPKPTGGGKGLFGRYERERAGRRAALAIVAFVVALAAFGLALSYLIVRG